MISVYRAKLKSIVIPSAYLAVGTGILFFLAILIKEGFRIDQKMIEAFLILTVVSFLFDLFLILKWNLYILLQNNYL